MAKIKLDTLSAMSVIDQLKPTGRQLGSGLYRLSKNWYFLANFRIISPLISIPDFLNFVFSDNLFNLDSAEKTPIHENLGHHKGLTMLRKSIVGHSGAKIFGIIFGRRLFQQNLILL